MVGQVLASLDKNSLTENTIVIFTSDNGGMFNIPGQNAFGDGHKLNSELLGFKFGIWEGGHRVPFIVRWPGKVKPGTTSKQLISNIDMLATFAAVTGQELDQAQQADSLNVLHAFIGEPQKALRDHLILMPAQRTHLSVRQGKWMYIPAQGSGGFTGTKPGDHNFAGPAAATLVGSVNRDFENGRIRKDAPPVQLYDLEADLKQTTNVYSQYREVVKEMSSLLKSYGNL
jgi:arylsulfatase A-like enzyme